MINRRRFIGQAAIWAAACVFSAAHAGASAAMAGMEGHHHEGSAARPAVLVDMMTEPPQIRTGSEAAIRFFIKNDDGTPQRELTVTHDRLLHVIIISRNFGVFAHVHPDDFGPITQQMKEEGRYAVRYTFPLAGEYLIALDSAVGDSPFSEQFSVEVTGEPRMGPAGKDLSRARTFAGYEVRLETSPEGVTAGRETTLSYLVKKNGAPVTDLEPYLSAGMHLAVVSADLNNFIHAHGGPPGAEGAHAMASHMHMAVPASFGPRIDAAVVFPAKGLYQVFGEFKHRGKVITTSFIIEVE